MISGDIFSLRSSARTPMKRDATLEKIWRMSNGNGKPRKSISRSTKDGCRPPCIDLAMAIQGFDIDNTAARQKKVCTVSRGRLCLMYVMNLSTMTMLLLLARMPNRDGEAGMKTMLRDINVISNGTGQEIPYASSWSLWFGSINMMNILYVWFPASWGPSVVEAIQTRNVTCLAKKPIVRDPHIFDRKEAARGSRAREVTCRIQKWNIKAEGFHPILVANARVEWLAMDDDDITKKFPILLEGILQDVFSQRAASAWQGAQPQKLTVSMLLPGTSSAAEWRDLLQSRRQFWPTLTTRHASLVPVSAEALQRERRQMQAKHLWYNVDIRWVDLKDKLEVLAPTGLTRDDIWRHLFLTKQRKNPYLDDHPS